MKIIYKILFLYLVTITQAQASEVGYEVEVIIFENLSEKYNFTENWPEIVDESPLTKEVKSSGNKDQKELDKIFLTVDKENFKLNTHKSKISNNQNYRVLFHSAWKQKGLARENAIPFPINTKNNNVIDNSIHNTDLADTPPSPEKSKHQSFIKGNVTLILSRYLHLESSLIYYQINDGEQEVREADKPDSESFTMKYPVKSERRMRSREIHYIDHPLVGILVLATPFTIPEETQEETPKEYKEL